VLFLVFGSSAGGKTTALNVLRKRMPDFAIHDFDEVGVPPGADIVWRHRANEQWVQRALEYQVAGTDLLLAGQTPYGEMLAAPSAPLLDGISGCLIDCPDEIRAARLEGRGATWFARSAGDLQSEFTWPEWIQRHLDWAAWMRAHAGRPHAANVRHQARRDRGRDALVAVGGLETRRSTLARPRNRYIRFEPRGGGRVAARVGRSRTQREDEPARRRSTRQCRR
jgi:hypothetical protein